MAKAYRLKRDLAIPLVVGHDDENEVVTGTGFAAGAMVRDDQLTKYHRQQIEDGKLDDLFEPVSDEEAEAVSDIPNTSGEPEHGIFFPEHEAERVALQIGGHLTVPKEQELEILSQGEGHSADHMAQVKESGYDRRPVQEHMAQVEGRIDDSVLQGGQTAAGVPHNRGPESEGGSENGGDGNDSPAARPAPHRSEGEQGS